MIRINLVAGERRAAKASAGRSFQVGQKMTVVGSLLLVITVLGVGWRYMSLMNTKAQVTRDIDTAKREEARLAEVLKQVADFEARKTQIEQRVALIDELRKGQNAPVHMIDQISRALPDMTWLTSMRQEGYDVTIQGRTLTLTSLSDFVGNLEASRYFKRPVEIIDSGVSSRQQTQEGPQLIEFTIRGTFQMSGIDSTPPAPPGRKAPPKRGGKNG